MSLTSDDARARSSQVSWGAIAAGTVVASGFGIVLLGFGAGLGLSATSPYEGEGWSPVAYITAAGMWLLWVQILSFYFGGYVTGRLRNRPYGASEHEADVGDSLHGLVVWGAGVVLATAIALAGIGGASAAGAAADRNTVGASVSEAITEEVTQGASAERADGPPEAQVANLAERRAEVVRKVTIISAFITAASLLAGAVAAFFGAAAGGNHRDAAVQLPFFTHRKVVIKS